MANLVVCSGCARHVLAHEQACPFCGATVPIIGRTPGLTGVVAASVVAAALAGAGCGGATPAPAYGPPAQQDSTEVRVLPPDDNSPPMEPAADAGPGDEGTVSPEVVEERDPPPAVALYAPPPPEE